MPLPAVLEVLTNFALGLAGGVVLLSLLLLIERTVAALTSRRAQRREAELAPLVYQAIQEPAGSPFIPRSLNRFDRHVVRGILLRLAVDLRGDTGDAIAALYESLGLFQTDEARLGSWSVTRRARAAVDLGLIRARGALPALLRAIEDGDIRVRQAAAWAVGQVADREALIVLIRLLGDPSTVVARRAQEVLVERGREIEDALISYAGETSSRDGRLRAIELIGWLRVSGAVELLLGLMTDPDPEIRVKAVKAAAATGDPRFLDPFHHALEDSQWEVRCQAARGLSVLGSPLSVPRLSRALRDPQWWVRFYAAVALAEVGVVGEVALTEALEDGSQPARDMARYLLERGSAVPALP
jgi:HEAT repeat protein